ncbi:MAG: hypothetical protein Q9172_000294 [Xanthocarpia lactea]
MQQLPYPGRPAVTPLGGPFNGSYGFVGQAPAAQMIPAHGEIQYSGMPYGYPMRGPISESHASSNASTTNTPITSSSDRSSQKGETQDQRPIEGPVNRFGREAYDVPPPLMFNYPAKVDPTPPNEPRNIPIPTDHSLVLALSDHDKAKVDSDYMGFLIVMERIWPSFLCEHLEDFCRQHGPTFSRKEIIEMECSKSPAGDIYHGGIQEMPDGIEPTEHLSDDAAREVLANLVTRFWRSSSSLSYKIYRGVISEWDELQEPTKSSWNNDTLNAFVGQNVEGLLKAWAEEPYFGDGKTQVKLLQDEYIVRLRKEHVRLNMAEYQSNVRESTWLYVHGNLALEAPPEDPI